MSSISICDFLLELSKITQFLFKKIDRRRWTIDVLQQCVAVVSRGKRKEALLIICKWQNQTFNSDRYCYQLVRLMLAIDEKPLLIDPFDGCQLPVAQHPILRLFEAQAEIATAWPACPMPPNLLTWSCILSASFDLYEIILIGGTWILWKSVKQIRPV